MRQEVGWELIAMGQNDGNSYSGKVNGHFVVGRRGCELHFAIGL